MPRVRRRVDRSRTFNLMFRTHIGPVDTGDNVVYLRPETAQAMFVDFDNVVNSSRVRIPFGIAQQRQVVPQRDYSRQLHIQDARGSSKMEMEYFCEPGTDEEWHRYWIDFSMDWFSDLGIRRSKLRVREHGADELPHYSKEVLTSNSCSRGVGANSRPSPIAPTTI